MSHHNDHHHHKHSHGHSSEKHSPDGKELTFDHKIVKLLEHWVQHNHDHARNYREWSDRARENGLESLSRALVDAAGKTNEITRIFEEALRGMEKGPIE